MIVEALRTEKGILIPFTEELSYIRSNKILLEIEVLHSNSCGQSHFKPASELFGIFRHRKPSKPVSIEEMEAAVQERRKQ